MRNLSSKRADGRIIKTDLDEGVEGLREALQTSKEEVRKGWLAGLKSQEEEFGFSALAVVWEIEETVGEELFDSLNREELFALKQALREQVQPVLIFLNKPGFSQKIDFLSFPLSLVLGIKGIELVSRRKGEGFLGRIFFEGERNGLFFLEREGEILQPMLLRRKAENFSLLVDLLLLATIRDITLYYQTMRRKRKGFSWRQAAIPLSEKRLFDFFGERGLLLEARPETFFLQERVPHSIPFLARDWVDPQTAEVNNHLVYLSQTSPLGEEVKSLVQKRGAREVFQARFSKTSSLEALEKIFLGLLE